MDRPPQSPAMTPTAPSSRYPAQLGAFLRRHAGAIVVDWEQSVRQLPALRRLERPLLIDQVPSLLRAIAAVADALAHGDAAAVPQAAAEQHALERLDEGVDLEQLVTEYALLRDCIAQRWEDEIPEDGTPRSLRVLDQAIDAAIAAAITAYTGASRQTRHVIEGTRAEEVRADAPQQHATEGPHGGEERFRSIIEHAADMILIVDVAGLLLYRSSSVQRLLGFEEVGGAGGESVLDCIHTDDRAAVAAALADVTRSEGAVGLGDFRLADVYGAWHHIEAVGRRLPDTAGSPSIVINARDVTERRRAEEAVRHAHEELEMRVAERTAELSTLNEQLQAEIRERQRAEAEREGLLARAQADRERAEQSSRAKDEFLAVVSHELRTPLTPLLTWARLLRTQTLDPAAMTRAYEGIDRCVRTQVQLIEDLLDVSRIVTGKFRLTLRSVELAQVIDLAIDSVRPTADAKGIQLHAVFDRPVGVVSGDPNRLQQVVWNLLSNAIKFTPKGGRVNVRLQAVHSNARITVSDTGQGIKPEFMPYIFERFRQADSTSTRAYGGLGIGLAIVRHLVELHGGRIHAASPGEGHGTTFVVELPLAAMRIRAAAEPSSPLDAHVPFEPERLRGVRVLVVDDESDTLETLHAVLTASGADVRTSHSTAEALATLQQWPPTVLVSDIGMPGEDGYALIRKVRALDSANGGDIPAIALTAYARVEDRLKVLGTGFQMHISKPIEPSELVAVVASVAALRRAPA